jgi:hypothetical protein
MVRRRTHSRDSESHEEGNGPQAEETRAEGRRNGAADPSAAQPDGQETTQAASPTMQRAEELVDRLADRVGHYAGILGHKLAWLAARTREEAEDIWAEAQAIRRGEHH